MGKAVSSTSEHCTCVLGYVQFYNLAAIYDFDYFQAGLSQLKFSPLVAVQKYKGQKVT